MPVLNNFISIWLVPLWKRWLLMAAWTPCALWWASGAVTTAGPHSTSVNSLAQGCSDPHLGLYPRPNFRELGLLGGSPEPLALILARVGHPHVLPSLHLLQTVLLHFLLGEDEEEDTTGEADGPRDGEMCTGFGQGLGLSQRSWKNQSSFATCTNATVIPLTSVVWVGCRRDPTNQILLQPA